jgi:ubiquitin-protein ligase
MEIRANENFDSFDVNVNEDDICHWKVTIHGPPDSQFEGGIFRAQLNFPTDCK